MLCDNSLFYVTMEEFGNEQIEEYIKKRLRTTAVQPLEGY